MTQAKMSNTSNASTPAQTLASITDVIAKPEPKSNPGRVGLWALALGLGGFLLWAGLAPLDEGVPGQGMVTIDTKSKAVQHLSGGIIKEVLVKEGDVVKEGQLLVKLDEAATRANFEATRQRYLGLRAMEARLLTEQKGQGTISWHPDLREAIADPQIRQMTLTQEQLFASRRNSLQADLQAIEESVQGQQALLQAYSAMLGNSTRAQRAINEMRQRAIVRQQDYRKDVESQLADVGREVQADAQKYQAVKDDLGRIDIKSPAAGQVVGLAFQSVGGVIGPGQKLMDIVPASQALMLEARISPHLIDRVHAELPVDVRFSSFANSPQLVVDGKVASVSGDLLIDNRSGGGYYLVRVALTAEGLKKLGKRQMQPGMPVEVVFRTGERSMLTYLLHPLTRRMAASMKEE